MRRRSLGDAELVGVVAGKFDFVGGDVAAHAGEVRGKRPVLLGDDAGDGAGGEDAVVEVGIVLREDHVAAGLATEEDAVVPHAAAEDRVAGAGENGLAAVRAHIVNGRAGAFQVHEDAGAGVAGEHVAGKQGGDPVRVIATALLIDQADAVAVAVPGDAQVGPLGEYTGGQVTHAARLLWVGEVVGEALQQLRVEADDIGAQGPQGGGAGERGDAVAGIDDHFERPRELEPAPQHGDVVRGRGRAGWRRAGRWAGDRSRPTGRGATPAGSRRARGASTPRGGV